MPQFLFRITKRKWDKVEFSWLSNDEIQADPLGDLRVSNGNLSVWHVEDDKSNLDQIIVALAVTRDTFDKFEYALVRQEALEQAGISKVVEPGKTPVTNVNHWHRDLIELTINKVTNLVNIIFNDLEKVRVPEKEVKEKIEQAVKSNSIDLQKVKPSMRNKIDELKSNN